jgi:hypothetical protein
MTAKLHTEVGIKITLRKLPSQGNLVYFILIYGWRLRMDVPEL